jgi:CheY-like chemotaxis protein
LVLADLSQINQVLMNLCTNAAHAMRENGGVMAIELEEKHVTEAETGIVDGLGPGDYVVLSVTDSGCGMTPEVAARIFDPFFSTKAVNEGTGMGLSVVHGIVKAHGGAVGVQCQPGRGSRFTVYLPVYEETRSEPTPCVDPLVCGQKERVLLVDDEVLILEMGQMMLERLGYEVEVYAHPADALTCFTTDPDRYHVVITDQGMPVMTGLNLARELKAIRATVSIVLCTGFSDTVGDEKETGRFIDAFLMKPIVMGQLAVTLRHLLDKAAPK